MVNWEVLVGYFAEGLVVTIVSGNSGAYPLEGGSHLPNLMSPSRSTQNSEKGKTMHTCRCESLMSELRPQKRKSFLIVVIKTLNTCERAGKVYLHICGPYFTEIQHGGSIYRDHVGGVAGFAPDAAQLSGNDKSGASLAPLINFDHHARTCTLLLTPECIWEGICSS